jgi:hypothetical protein
MLRIALPSVITSRVAAILARRAGFLKGAARHSWPSLVFSVMAARAARVVQHSSLGESGPLYSPTRWSLTHRESYPSSSQSAALALRVEYSLSSGKRNAPNSIPSMLAEVVFSGVNRLPSPLYGSWCLMDAV